MFGKPIRFTIPAVLLGAALCASGAWGQAAPPQFFIVCVSQMNQPSVYMSGVLEGPATAIQSFTSGFTQFLKQTYSYQGVVACAPGRTSVNAQAFVQDELTALHNMKKNVVQTGWTAAAPGASGGVSGGATNVLGNLLGAKTNTAAPASSTAKAPAPSRAGNQPANANAAQGGNSAPGASVVQIFNNLFASPSAGGSGSNGGTASSTGSASPTAKAPQGQAAPGKTASGSTSSTSSEVATVLSNLLAKQPGSAGGANADASPEGGKPGAKAPTTPAPEASSAMANNALPDGALGTAQYANTRLTVYGCGRQGTQVLCVTDLTNQNPQDTLVQSAPLWKDAFIVDDRGDRHPRADGYFLNVDGDRRQEMDIEYGKSAHFILAFDTVQAKVEKVTLRSTIGGLNVRDIALVNPDAPSAASDSQSGTTRTKGGTAN